MSDVPTVKLPAVDLGTTSPAWIQWARTLLRAYTTPGGREAMGQFWEDAFTRMTGVVMAYGLKWQAVAARLLMDAWGQAEKEQGPVVAQLAAMGISDLFDVPVSPGDVGTSLGKSRVPLHNRIGQAIIEGILARTRPTGGVTPEHGVRAAESVLGFSVGHATEGWIQGLYFGGPLSAFFNEELQNLDDVVASAAGLGSMARRAVGPILRILVAEPFTRYLNQQYRPRIFSETHAARALRCGLLTYEEYYSVMAELGWSREKAAILDVVLAKQPEKEDLLKLRELSLADENEMATLLRASGYTEDMARILAKALQEDKVRSWRGSTASVIRDMVRDRDLGAADARRYLAELGYTDLETRTLLDLADLERNRYRLPSESDMEQAFIQGFQSIGDLHAYYVHRGYDYKTTIILEALVAQKRAKARA